MALPGPTMSAKMSADDRKMSKSELYIVQLERFSGSGLSARAYCQKQGIAYSTFRRWAKRLNYDLSSRTWHRGKHPHSKTQLDVYNRQQHGVYSFKKCGFLLCGRCPENSNCGDYREDGSCSILETLQENLVDRIMRLPQNKESPEHAILASLLAREAAIQELIMRFLDREGLVVKTKSGLDVQPIMKIYWTSVGSLSRLCDRLGIGPQAKKSLGIRSGGEVKSVPEAVMEARMAESEDDESEEIPE